MPKNLHSSKALGRRGHALILVLALTIPAVIDACDTEGAVTAGSPLPGDATADGGALDVQPLPDAARGSGDAEPDAPVIDGGGALDAQARADTASDSGSAGLDASGSRCLEGKPSARPGDRYVHPAGIVGPTQLAALRDPATMARPERVAALQAAIAQATKNLAAGHASAATVASGDELAFRGDAQAAWELAVLFEATCDARYASGAQAIVRAWSKATKTATTWTNPLFTGWGLLPMARTVELLDRTWVKWDAADTVAFLSTSATVMEPAILDWLKGRLTSYGSWMNNWQTLLDATLMQLALMREDASAVAYARTWYVRILTGVTRADATKPGGVVSDAYIPWSSAILLHAADRGTTLEDCRDAWHPLVGLASLFDAAETAANQGDDLFGFSPDGVARPILLDALEKHSAAVNASKPTWGSYNAAGTSTEWNTAVYPYLTTCTYPLLVDKDAGTTQGYYYVPADWEVAYAHFAQAGWGAALPETRKLIAAHSPEWEEWAWGLGTLTHAYR